MIKEFDFESDAYRAQDGIALSSPERAAYVLTNGYDWAVSDTEAEADELIALGWELDGEIHADDF